MKYVDEKRRNAQRHIEFLEKKGFCVTTIQDNYIIADIDTDNGMMEIIWGDNGTACISKPNGSHKWYYEKSESQMLRIIDQTIDANTYKRYH